jgi:ATP/maltotriose-dependent transcriptional regulator MalT
MRFANPLNDIARAVAGDDTALQRLAATPPTARDHVIISRLGAALSSHATRLALTGPAIDDWHQSLLQAVARRLRHLLEIARRPTKLVTGVLSRSALKNDHVGH